MKRPSPATVISVIALVFAMTGTAFAAVNYATNAGAVDGKSAYADGTSLARSAGDLVATQRSGDDRGRLAAKYLDLDGLARGTTDTFGTKFDVVDQATLAPQTLVAAAGFGSLTVSCRDQNATAGRVDPQVTVTYANQSGDAVGFFRRVGNGEGSVRSLLNGTTDSFTVDGSRDFEVWAEQRGRNLLIRGVVRQDGRGATGDCVVYGLSIDTTG